MPEEVGFVQVRLGNGLRGFVEHSTLCVIVE